MNFRKILIAVDNSTCSEKAAKVGYEMAEKFNADVALVNIIEPIPAGFNADLALAPIFLETYDNSEENSHLLLQAMESKYSNGIRTKYYSVLGNAIESIIEQADDWHADLIVIGSYGRNGFYNFLMGSVSHHVIRKSACPVLIIPNKYEV